MSHVCITTSRSPSPRSRTLVNALALVTPARKVTRGKKSLKMLFEECGQDSTLIVVFERFGNPAGFLVYRRGQPAQTLSFSGFNVSRGLKKLVDKAGVSRVAGSPKTPKTEAAQRLKDFLVSLPETKGKLVSSIDVFEKDNREVLSLVVRGVQCVNFYFKLN